MLPYNSPRNLIALAGIGSAIYGFLNLNLLFIGLGAAVLGYFAFFEG
ncbi:MAG: hypothetical protein R6X33_18920 [Candidatus Brocadiia bacterium]